MKSIYDEAIKIFNGTETDRTQEEMLAIGNLFDAVREDCVLLLTKEENDLINKALERAKKVAELLELYRLKNYNMEDYYTYNSLRGSQTAFDNLKDINEEICIKENELEELK